MPPTTLPRTRAVDAPLSPGDEALLAALVEELSDRKSTRLNSSHEWISRMPSSA